MNDKLKVICINTNGLSWWELTVKKVIYTALHTYMDKEYLILNDRGFEKYYDKELFEEVK